MIKEKYYFTWYPCYRYSFIELGQLIINSNEITTIAFNDYAPIIKHYNQNWAPVNQTNDFRIKNNALTIKNALSIQNNAMFALQKKTNDLQEKNVRLCFCSLFGYFGRILPFCVCVCFRFQ